MSECEDNLKNLFSNFPIYVENGKDIDFLSYELVGTVKSEEDAKKYVTKNFDDFVPLGYTSGFRSDNTSEFYKAGIPGRSSMKFSIDTHASIIDKSMIKNMINTIPEVYVNVGDKVYAIDYVLE